MARDFESDSEYLNNNNAVVSSTPLTLAVWFYVDDTNAGKRLLAIGDAGTSDNLFNLWADNAEALHAQHYVAPDNGQATITGPFSLNTWHHACGVFTSNSSRSCFIDGGSKVTESATTVSTPSGLDYTALGVLRWTADQNYMRGRLAEAAVWNTNLSDAEVSNLGSDKYSPLLVSPDNLIAYWPIYGDASPEPDFVGGYDMTLTGTPVKIAHPTGIVYPPIPKLIRPAYHPLPASYFDI